MEHRRAAEESALLPTATWRRFSPWRPVPRPRGELTVSVLVSYLPWLVVLAGAGQLVLIVASLAIPFVLRWREELAKVRPLTRQVFWTYSLYIWATNLSFGLVSLRPDWLLDRSPLAGCVTGFMSAYWVGRILIQFFYFDRSSAPPGLHVHLAEIALVMLFFYLALVYSAALFFNLGVLAP
jgi:hypothetical protein